MSKFLKIGLYLSSFSPLFILIIIKELVEIMNGNWSFNFLNTSLLITMGLFLIVGIFSLIFIYKEIKNSPVKEIKIIGKKNITDQHFLGYFSIFVLFAVTFEIEMYSMALIFLIVLILIGVVYIRNDMYYINPLINVLGFSFYDIECVDKNDKNHKFRVFHKGKLLIGQKYLIQDKHANFVFVREKQIN